MYDCFIAELHCSHCGHTASLAENTNMQTHLRDDADGAGLKIGFRFDPAELETRRVLDSSYLLVVPPGLTASIRLLNTWSCPVCQKEQWAAVTIQDAVISRIDAVSLTKQALAEANFIGQVDAEQAASRVLGISPWDLTEQKLDPIEVLRQHLPD